MRVITLMFALLLVTGFSFMGNSFFGSTPSIAADEPAGEMPGGEMTDAILKKASEKIAKRPRTAEREMEAGV